MQIKAEGQRKLAAISTESDRCVHIYAVKWHSTGIIYPSHVYGKGWHRTVGGELMS